MVALPAKYGMKKVSSGGSRILERDANPRGGGLNEENELRVRARVTTDSPIHKAAGSLVTGRSLQNGKMSMGNRRTE